MREIYVFGSPEPPSGKDKGITPDQVRWAKAQLSYLDPDSPLTLRAYELLLEAKDQGKIIEETYRTPGGEMEKKFTDGFLRHTYDMLKTGALRDLNIPEPPKEIPGAFIEAFKKK